MLFYLILDSKARADSLVLCDSEECVRIGKSHILFCYQVLKNFIKEF